jgi:hypothetical protein
MSQDTNKTKLVSISQPGDYTVRACKLRPEDCSLTQKGDPKIKVLMVTEDSLKINDTFFGSTDGALKRAAAFVSTATGKKLGLPPKTQQGLFDYLNQAAGSWLKVTVVQEDVTFADGNTRRISKVTKFSPAVKIAPAQDAPPF